MSYLDARHVAEIARRTTDLFGVESPSDIPETVMGFPVMRLAHGLGRYTATNGGCDARSHLTAREVLDAVDAMSRDELDRLRRRIAGVPDRSPVLFVPDGRGGYQDPEFGKP